MDKLYDTLLFIVIRANEEVMFKRLFRHDNKDFINDIQPYSLVKASAPDLPDVLSPLCYCAPSSSPCYLMHLMRKYTALPDVNDTARFCLELQRDTRLLSDFLDYIFPELPHYDRAELLSEDPYKIHSVFIRIFPEYNIPQNLLSPFEIFASSSYRVVGDLVRLIRNIYAIIHPLHEERADHKNTVREIVLNNREFIDKKYNLSPAIPMKSYVSIINPYVLQIHRKNEKYEAIAGHKYLERLEFNRPQLCFEDLVKLWSSKIALNIFQELRKTDITANSIIQKYQYSPSSVYATLDKLYDEHQILISGNTGRERCYTLNKKMFQYLAEDINNINS